MKKVIPVFIAVVLIFVVVGVSFGKQIYDRYSYGQEMADLNEYFDIYDSSDIPIVLGNEKTGVSAKYINNNVYLSLDIIEDYFTERFYIDENENLLLYTTAEATCRTEIGTDSYQYKGEEKSFGYPLSLVKNDKMYIAIDYVKLFANFSYEIFDNPNHMQVYTEWEEKKIADLKGDTKVRRLAGVKAGILTDALTGDTVEVLDVIDAWTKVKTKDAYIGYVESKFLENERNEKPVPVTDVNENFVSLTRDYRINLTWDYMEYPQDGGTLRNTVAYAKELNVISPTWYWLTDNDGSLKSVANSNYVDMAHNLGMEVWALVSNFHSGYDVDTYEVLSYTSKRASLIESLVNTTVEYGADGINVDFESVPAKAGTHFVQFIRELGLACHENNLVLSVDNYVPTEYTAHYNRKQQSLFADYIIIMGYDEHYEGSDAGSVSSIDWMSKGIENTLKYVPENKVINAVPFYTRVWKTKGGTVTSEAVTMEVANSFVSRNNIALTWDSETNQNYGEMTADGTFYQVWMEDADSMTIRLNVMKNFGIAGMASWRISQETPDIWDVIEKYMLY